MCDDVINIIRFVLETRAEILETMERQKEVKKPTYTPNIYNTPT